MKYANKSQNKRDRGISIRALLLMLALVTSIALPTLRPAVSHAQASGTVVGWGNNDFDQLNIPAGLSGVTAIEAGQVHSLALKSDGTVVGWGTDPLGSGAETPPAGLIDVTAISAGGGLGLSHSLGLKSDGTVVAWGNNLLGQLDIPAGLSGVVAISAGGLHSLALKSDGTVVDWGDNSVGQLDIPAGLTSVMAISAGAQHSLALKCDGTVVGWGLNDDGQATPPAGLNGVVAISAGGIHSLALVSAFDLDDLIALVNGLNIHHGIKNSLLAKLNAADAALAAGDTATACTKLGDFINECEAQSGKKLSVEQADELIARANEIRTSLGCP